MKTIFNLTRPISWSSLVLVIHDASKARPSHSAGQKGGDIMSGSISSGAHVPSTAQNIVSIFGLLFAGFSYTLFLLTFTMFALRVSGVWTPDGVNVGIASSFLVNFVLVLVFAVQHTIMARAGFKIGWSRIVSPHLERSTFVLFSSLSMAGIVFLWQPISGHVWEVNSTLGQVFLYSLFGLGYLGVVASTFLIDHFYLFGLKQAWSNFKGHAIPRAEFKEPWPYKKVRHPMMTCVLVMMWATPSMSLSQAFLAGLFTLYVFVGTVFEEKELQKELGVVYENYQKRVPKLFPMPKAFRKKINI